MKKQRILLYSADPSLRHALSALLERSLPKASVQEAASPGMAPVSGCSAIFLLDAEGLNPQDGRELRFLTRLAPQTKVVILSSLESASVEDRELFSFADVVLRKPVDNRVLISVLKNLLES
jgi:DNA-binding response OmpR family regulator